MKVSKDTILRTIVLALALVNQILAITGRGTIDIAEEDIYQLGTLIATVGASIWAWWKNNSFTHEAKMADDYMKGLKADRGKVGSENSDVNTEEEHIEAEGGATNEW